MDYDNLSYYLLDMALAHILLDRKILRKDEYLDFEDKMRKNYGLPKESIFRDYTALFDGPW